MSVGEAAHQAADSGPHPQVLRLFTDFPIGLDISRIDMVHKEI